jgi:hypothetical protein
MGQNCFVFCPETIKKQRVGASKRYDTCSRSVSQCPGTCDILTALFCNSGYDFQSLLLMPSSDSDMSTDGHKEDHPETGILFEYVFQPLIL